MSEPSKPLPLDYAPPAPSPWPRRLPLASAALGLLPLLFLAALYLTYLAGRLHLGHWPRCSLDDPKSIGGLVDPLYLLTMLLLITLPPAFFLHLATLLASLALHLSKYCRLRRPLLLLLPLLVWPCAYLFLRWDPARILDWFMD